MKKTLITLFLISSLIGFSSCKLGDSIEETFPGFKLEEGKLYEVRGKAPYTGELTDHYEDGTLKMKSEFHEGLQTSTIHYYENGNKKSKNINTDNAREMTIWYITGQKKEEILPGFIREWHINGHLKAEVKLDELNEYHGYMKMWDEEGILIVHEIYENGTQIETIKTPE